MLFYNKSLQRVTNTSLLYGLLKQDEAYLIPTWLMQEQSFGWHSFKPINQSINML